MSLTPQMRQSIKLLGMSAYDVSEYIDTVAANNPFLKKYAEMRGAEKFKGSSLSNIEENAFSEAGLRLKQPANPRLELLGQLKASGLPDTLIKITEYLIFEMDDNGYISCDLEDAANELSCAIKEVETGLAAIQGMEPAGMGARDLRECLELQLKRKGKEDSLEYRIVGHCLNDIAANEIHKISKALKANEKAVKNAIDNIKKLNPRPASTVLARESEEIIPELIAKIENNKVRLEVNRSCMPDLKIYNPYEKDLDIIKDPDARKFLKENMDYAKSLIDGLKRREETVCKVADYILSFQRDAVLGGMKKIKSLTISDVAAGLGYNPSTVSRAVRNKYVRINGVTEPLKNFLSHGIKNEGGDIISKTSVKKKIESQIKNEDPLRPLRDASIQKNLAEEGIIIARRTVAKYRESLRILPSALRRKK